MRRFALLFAPVLAVAFVVPAAARDEGSVARYVSPQHAAAERAALAAFGPFRVIDERTVAIVDVTDERSPAQFAALLARYPGIATLDFVEAPGTHDDSANFALARMVRAHGIATRAPAGGSVRSGAVELFLAGVTRTIDAGSEFAVHGWLDDMGRGAEDFAQGAPEHRAYLDYYVEMGMAEAEARAFYAMTNSVPFESALWLTGREMQGWVGDSELAGGEARPRPALTYAALAL